MQWKAIALASGPRDLSDVLQGRGSIQPSVERFEQLVLFDGFGHIIVHPRVQAFLAVIL